MKALKAALKEDSIYQRHFTKILQIELKDEAWAEELESLHARRDIRSLNSSSLLQSAQKVALDNNIDNQTVRSRCVEIKMRAMKQYVVFEKSKDLLRKYIPAKYGKMLKDTASTVHERREVVDYILNSVSDRMARMKHVVDLCDLIIDDCDQAGYTLMRINTLLEQRSKDK